jgi:hypothetical protein
MDQRIVLFPHKGIKAWLYSFLPLSILEGIMVHTYRRNKIIHQKQATEPQFILSGITELTKRINRIASILEAYLHRRVRYINTHKCKGNCKNAYQVVGAPMNGGNRP